MAVIDPTCTPTFVVPSRLAKNLIRLSYPYIPAGPLRTGNISHH